MAASSKGVSEHPAVDNALRLHILGPLRLWRNDVELDPGPRQQAVLLALLLVRADHPVSRGELIGSLWDDKPPGSAVNVIHKYVGALRRVLEPDLPARASGSYLQRRGDGYQFASRNSGLDLVAFRGLVNAARTAVNQDQPRMALDHFVEAVALWRGSAGAGLGLGLAAAPIFVGLNGEFFEACVAAADLAVQLHEPQRCLPALQLAASMAALNEDVHAALVTSLGAAGRRPEALTVLGAVRARLADDLGLDPGPALRAAQQQVLTETVGSAVTVGGHRDMARAAGGNGTSLIGRAHERALLAMDMRSVLAGGSGVVVIDGEPGVGKTRLLREMTARAEISGAFAVWGMCLDGDGTPSMWPWVKLVGALLGAQPVDERADWLGGELGRFLEPARDDATLPAPPDSGSRFRLFEQVVDLVGRAATRQPVVIVIDDLQWADLPSLELFTHLSSQLPKGALIAGALRDRGPTPGAELSRHLAAVSRTRTHRRIHLNPLSQGEVAELVRRETGDDPGDDAVRGIYARTAGNPFFVRELSRLLDRDGALASAYGPEVPSTVRDVVRTRTADLDEDVRRLLQIAALIGRDVSLPVLAHATGTDVATCLKRLHPLAALGVLEPTPGDPFYFRFPHDLVRESVADVIAPRESTELHLQIADALEAVTAHDDSATERLAFHLWKAGPLADPARTVVALVRAGRRAASKSAFEAAERQLQSAIRVARSAGLAELELSAVAPLATVFWRQAGFGASYTDLLTRAESLARGLGQDANAADFLFMRVIAGFSQHDPHTELLTRELLARGGPLGDPIARAYARHIQGLNAFEVGDTGAALRYMDDDDWTPAGDATWQRENPLRRDLRMFAPLTRALILTLHGDTDAARTLLTVVEDVAGDDPYAVSVWAHWAVDAAQWAGDPVWCRSITERWRTADPNHLFVNVDSYLRVGRCWALALTGDDPANAAAEAERIVGTTMLDPPMYGVTQDQALIADMLLAAGMHNEAGIALDRADRLADLLDERFAECFRLLIRAKLLHARGEPADVVQAAAAHAKEASIERGTYIIARRSEELMVSISSSASD